VRRTGSAGCSWKPKPAVPRKKLEIWTLDAETDPFKKGRDRPLPFLWGAYCLALDRYETFGHGRMVRDFFAERRACVYAHNGGRFDFHYLREFFESENPVLVINGRLAKFYVGRAEFRDSFSLLPVPLAEYEKEEIDYNIFEEGERDKPENRARIETYLKSDCVNLAKLLYSFFEKFGRPLTMAGCAMMSWAKGYNNGVKPRQSAAQFERYKPFYYGGRVECFAAGYAETSFNVVDKNSAYPDAMLREHPASPLGDWRSDIPSDIEACLLCVEAVSEGALPYREENGALIFPRDRTPRVYWVTGWELKAGLDLGLVKINKVYEVHHFKETQNFRGYIEHHYRERQRAREAGDKAMDLFAKLFMNSCYGKFASDPSKYNDFLIVEPARVAYWLGEGWVVYKPWGDGRYVMSRPQPEKRHWYYNIATAASITGYVRAQLLRDLHAARGLIYCDTDAIAAKSVAGLKFGRDLGEWKTELECDIYAVAGKKMYAFRSATDLYEVPKGEYKIACKGVDLTAAEIIRVARGETVIYEPDVPTFSITRPEPCLINRVVTMTARVQQ
jgi:DNA polymerase type B, organellar and viral